jgi:hypothetical protein
MGAHYMNPIWMHSYRDRYDSNFINTVADLLNPEQLMNTAKIAASCGLNQGQQRRITIKFAGLSSLTLLGGAENHYKKSNKTAKAFEKLLLGDDKLVDKDGTEYKLDIEFLFAYPYSDFNYNLILAEVTKQLGFSIRCMKESQKYVPNFYTPKRLGYEHLLRSHTYSNLISSLGRLQEYLIAAGSRFNSSPTGHRVVIKFSALNIMTCFLKINNHIFIDPYIYSKRQHDNEILTLLSPVTHLVLYGEDEWKREYDQRHPKAKSPEPAGDIPIKDPEGEKNETDGERKDAEAEIKDIRTKRMKAAYEKHKGHILSMIGHFRYLWHHPLAITSHDATYLTKGQSGTVSTIRRPLEISFEGKARAIEAHLTKLGSLTSNQREIDLWKQYVRNELLRHCSKFLSEQSKEIEITSTSQIKLRNIPVFIVGAWKKGDINNYMKTVKEFFEEPCSYITQVYRDVIGECDKEEVSKAFEELEIEEDEKMEDTEEKWRNAEKRALLRKLKVQLIGTLDKHKENEKERQKNEEAAGTSTVAGNEGLAFEPVIIDADDAEEIRKKIYMNLNESQLGFIIQTNDIEDSFLFDTISQGLDQLGDFPEKLNETMKAAISTKISNLLLKEYYSKPNVYLEKGYLMGRLGKRIDRSGREIEAVCVFKESKSHTESDNITMTHTAFVNSTEFRTELYRVVKWVWNITDINTDYALKLLESFKLLIEFKDLCQNVVRVATELSDVKSKDLLKIKSLLLSTDDREINYQRHLYKIQAFIKDLTRWRSSFEKRYELNFGHMKDYVPDSNDQGTPCE